MASSLVSPRLAAPVHLSIQTFDTEGYKTVRLGQLVANVTVFVVSANHLAKIVALSYDTAIQEGRSGKCYARPLVIEQDWERTTQLRTPRIVLIIPSSMNLDISAQFNGHGRVRGRLKRALTFTLRNGATLQADGSNMVLGTVASSSQLVVDNVTGEASIGVPGGYAHLQQVGGKAFAAASDQGVIQIDNAPKGVTMDIASQGRITVGNQLYT